MWQRDYLMFSLTKFCFRTARRYRKNRDGATAIEFAILAIPFFSLIFAILELSIVFFISSAMSHALSEAGRQVRVGNFQACGSADAFKALVCSNMASIGNCDTRLRIDVVSGPSFSAITMADPDPDDPDPMASAYTNTAANAPVVVRAQYYHNLALPSQLTRLENIPGTNVRRIDSITAFQNEPFPTPGACPSS